MAKHRIQILVEPEMFQLLRSLSEETGQPLSPMINSLLESLAPGLESTLTMARMVKKLDRETKDALSGHLLRVSDSIKGKVLENMEEAERLIKSVQ